MVAKPDSLRAVCLMGPTAAGKTDIAAALTHHFPVELISVDSVQVYRGMDIGAGKPPADYLSRYPHHLIDIRDPWEAYSAGEFCRDAAALIKDVNAAGRIPLLVGGTMLYFQTLQQGLADLPEADADIRAQLDARAVTEGWPALHAELQQLDPAAAGRLKPTDAQRIQRALEVCLVAGEPMTTLLAATAPPVTADYLNIGLLPANRAVLHARIEQRFDAMLEHGLLDEVATLLALPEMSPATASMRAVGYRQLSQLLSGELDAFAAREKAVVATRRLAKRQLTWLRSWPGLHEVDCLDPVAAINVCKIVEKWLAGCATA